MDKTLAEKILSKKSESEAVIERLMEEGND